MGNKVFIEYIMIGNINAAQEHAQALATLMVDHGVKDKVNINLIPYNPTEVGDEHEFIAPSDEQLEAFKSIVIEHGIFCTIRKSTTSGRDVDGACGQLALKGDGTEGTDIEDLVRKQKAASKPKRSKRGKKMTKKLVV